MLNAVAYDLRPFSSILEEHRKLIGIAGDNASTSERQLRDVESKVKDLDKAGDQWAKDYWEASQNRNPFASFFAIGSTLGDNPDLVRRDKEMSSRKLVLERDQRESSNKNQLAQHEFNKQVQIRDYLNSLNPLPQTYAEELPHRPRLRELGVHFEPYSNA